MAAKTKPVPRVEDYAGRGIPEAFLHEGQNGLLFLTLPQATALRVAASLIDQISRNCANGGRYEFTGVLIRDCRKTRAVGMSIAVRPQPPMVLKSEFDAVVAVVGGPERVADYQRSHAKSPARVGHRAAKNAAKRK